MKTTIMDESLEMDAICLFFEEIIVPPTPTTLLYNLIGGRWGGGGGWGEMERSGLRTPISIISHEDWRCRMTMSVF